MTLGQQRCFELQGAETNNKGAHLMALCVLDRLQSWNEHYLGCVYPRTVPKVWRTEELPVLRVFPTEASGSLRARVRKHARELLLRAALPERELRRYGLIPRARIDGLLDLSGYAYGDVWPHAESKIRAVEAYARSGKPVVLLPQMFGPFETERARSEFRRLCRAARLIVARDTMSFEQAAAIAEEPGKLAQAPDITIGFESPEPCKSFASRSGVVIVPNDKVLAKTNEAWGGSYVDRLSQLARSLRARGETITVLVHEGGPGDLRLATEIARATQDSEVRVVAHGDPRQSKRALGAARLVVGSRFHALVSALASGTPAIALGWAHKYETLAADFGVSELQHRPAQKPSELTELAESLLSEAAWGRVHSTIVRERARLLSTLDELWPRVRKALEA